MVKRWQFLEKLVRIGTLRRVSLTVLIASALRLCRMKLDRATSRKRMRIPQATRTFANGPAAIVRVEHVVRPAGPMERQDVLTVEDAAWNVQAVPEPLRALTGSQAASSP